MREKNNLKKILYICEHTKKVSKYLSRVSLSTILASYVKKVSKQGSKTLRDLFFVVVLVGGAGVVVVDGWMVRRWCA